MQRCRHQMCMHTSSNNTRHQKHLTKLLTKHPKWRQHMTAPRVIDTYAGGSLTCRHVSLDAGILTTCSPSHKCVFADDAAREFDAGVLPTTPSSTVHAQNHASREDRSAFNLH